jgi:hypothetical protein
MSAAGEVAIHRTQVHGHGFLFYWTCSCGKSGQPTTNGRATSGRDRHLRAALKRASNG